MNACASSETLERLMAGTASETEVDALRRHVAGCSHCQARLDELSDHSEVRQWAAGGGSLTSPMPREPELGNLLKGLREMVVSETSASQATRVYVDASLNFLAPPETAGELGTLGAYRVLAELGRGGMGIVFKAHDRELERVVALKVLRPERADEAARERFVREAQAAAGLHHDHVVPVYSVSSPPDGPPYLVMQYVTGPTLRERIRSEGRLAPREAARLTAQVADGLGAAHAAGLVHRDIKPANILLDLAQDRAKITDFGLVHLKGQPGGITLEGIIAGTPGYMSPEQIRTPESIDERADIYGLGVTLYEAVTGVVPFRGTPQMLVQQVLVDEPPQPRRLVDSLPADLETICLKAMAKDPGRRYQTAFEMRDDLRRWLAGEPIKARPVGRAERIWRWCRRKPALATLAAALLLALAVGFAGITWQWVRAEHNHDLADQRRRKAHQAIHDYFTLVSENKLLGKPGLQELRHELLGTALQYYQGFLAEWNEDRSMRAEVAATHVRVGAIQDQLGRHDAARNAYGAALTLYEELTQANPGSAEFQAAQARAHAKLGGLLSRTGSLAEALAALNRALAIQETLVEQDATDPDRRGELARIHMQIGVLREKQDRRQEARRALLQAGDSWQRLVDAHPERPEFRSELAATCNALSNLGYTAGDWDEALRYLAQAQALLQELVRQQPTVAEYQGDLADTFAKMANVHNMAGRLNEALDADRQARDIREKLVHENPAVTDYQYRLALAYAYLGKDYGQRSETLKDALACCDQALPLLQKLLRIAPGHPDYRQRLGDLYLDRGHYLSKLDQPAEALRCFDQARAILEDLVRDFRDRADFGHFLGVACHNHGNDLQQVGSREEARLAFERSRDLFRGLAEADPRTLFYQEMLVHTSNKLGGLHARAEEWEPAREGFQQGLAACRKLHEEQPAVPKYERLLAACYTNLGETARGTDRLLEAEGFYRQALAIREKFAKVHLSAVLGPELSDQRIHELLEL